MRTEVLQTPLWAVAAVLPMVLIEGWLLGSVARWLLRRRAKIGMANSIVIAILATSAGLALTSWVNPQAPLWGVLPVLLCLGLTVLGIAGYSALAAHFQRPQIATIAELLAAGESERVEFKSTARVNLHTGAKDDRMEQVIAKTVCGFLNADGGTLVIGVDDSGTPLGLDADLAVMKEPDFDRYELWLRDLLTICVGSAAATGVGVEFVSVRSPENQELPVCRVTVHASPRPVYLRLGKGTAPQLWVRSGNSTRQLAVDEATEYVMQRWPLDLGSSIAAQLRAAVRFSGGR